jgi:hypothetical protein
LVLRELDLQEAIHQGPLRFTQQKTREAKRFLTTVFLA